MAMKARRWLSVAAFVASGGLIGAWLLLGKAEPQPTSAARNPTTRPTRARASNEPVATPEGSLSGVVRSAAGDAIESARVCATTVRSEVSWTPVSRCATTNRQGSYRIVPLESTIYALSAFAEGFQPTTGPHGLDVTLGSGEAKTGLDIVLSPGGARLAGHVFDATGGPISGATIRVLRRVVPHETTVTRSAADGSFAVWMTKGPVTILAEASGYAPIRMAHVAPSSDLVLRLAPGSTVSGRVVAEGTAQEVRRSGEPFVRQFVNGEPDGPVAFHYPAQDYAADLDGIRAA